MDPQDRVHLGSRPVWKAIPNAGPLPGPLAPAVNQVLRDLHDRGVTFQAKYKPWFRQERILELSPEDVTKRLKKGKAWSYDRKTGVLHVNTKLKAGQTLSVSAANR